MGQHISLLTYQKGEVHYIISFNFFGPSYISLLVAQCPFQQGTFSDIQAYKRTFATLVTHTPMHSHTSPRYCQACCVLKTTGHPRHEKNNRELTVQQSAILKIPTFSKCFALGSERVLGQFDKQQQMKAFIFYSGARIDTAHSLPLCFSP